MTQAERDQYEANYAAARRILTLFRGRLDSFLESRGHAIDLRKVLEGHATSRDLARLDPREAWCLNVGWCLSMLGNRPAAYVLVARTTRRQKSAENAWITIAIELDDTCEHVRRMFEWALPMFLLNLEANGVTASLNGEPDIYSPSRCAAHERGHACVVGAASS